MNQTASAHFSRLRELLSLPQVNIYVVCAETGLSLNTVRSIKNGTGNPTLKTLEAIDDYLSSPVDGGCRGCPHLLSGFNEYACALRGCSVSPLRGCQLREVAND